MSAKIDEVVVQVPQGTKTVTIKIEPGQQARESKTPAPRKKICD